jgi:hypothetical protein
MADVFIRIPKDLEREFGDVKPIFWQLIVDRTVNEELVRLKALKQIVSRSRLTEKDVEELSDKANEALSERYRRLYLKG